MKQRTEYIYKIECKANGKVYVGRTCDITRRKREHFRKLKQNKHQNKNMQNSYNKYGEEMFEFYCVEETTPDLVKERELYYFNYFKSLGIDLFNHCITSSDGGVDSKSEITRTYIFEILDQRLAEGKSYKQLANQYKTSTSTLIHYTKEWEELRNIKMPKSIQSWATLQRITDFVKAFKEDSSVKYFDFNLSIDSLRKYLPLFDMSYDDVRLDKKFLGTKERCLKAIADVNAGMKLEESWKSNNISYGSYYKYLKETTPCT